MVFHDFQFDGAVKRMVHNGAHLRPIDLTPALISTALHNLCTCRMLLLPKSMEEQFIKRVYQSSQWS